MKPSWNFSQAGSPKGQAGERPMDPNQPWLVESNSFQRDFGKPGLIAGLRVTGTSCPGLALAREGAIRIKSPNQNAGAVLTTTALAWTLSPEDKQQFCLASGELLFFPDKRKTTMQQNVRASPENICTSSVSRVNHDRSEHQSPLSLKMDVVSTPKYMKNTI